MQKSLLDNDLYKFTMQQAVLDHYPNAVAKYKFINRRPENKFSRVVVERIDQAIDDLTGLDLLEEEYDWLKAKLPFLTPQYLKYLNSYNYDSSEVKVEIEDGALSISIEGPWHRTILWEVPLMAIISEAYFRDIHPDWNEFAGRTYNKGKLLNEHCKFADFGTRRRFSYQSQFIAVQELLKFSYPGFVGTSNVHLAMEFGTRPIGTMAHEWIMGISVLEGLRHTNRYALYKWADTYKADLGIALTDTYGTDAFFADCDRYLSKLYDGVRHDSGDPFAFVNKVISHYRSLNIDPATKTIVFSDGLDAATACKICGYCDESGINCSFGIGTNFTNDFPLVRPLNMVIKLWEMDGVPLCKLSDDPGKASGDPEAIRVAKWTFLKKPLDEG